jgi:hypothetical protein
MYMGCVQYICTGMVCTWRPLVEKFSILLWQARVGREIERYVREREEEMRKQQGGMTRALYDFTPLVVGGGAVSRLKSPQE